MLSDPQAKDRLVAIVPVKGLAAAKSRLSGVLSADERGVLALDMAGHVVESILASGAVGQLAVVSPDARVVAWARSRGLVALAQPNHGLNRGLQFARSWALEVAATALLVALADLPRLTAGEVRTIVELGASTFPSNRVVLAPDRDERGTNLMWMRPPSLMPFAFGEGSFLRHCAIARSLAGEPIVFRSPGTAFDVDNPADLTTFQASSACTGPFSAGERTEPTLKEAVGGREHT